MNMREQLEKPYRMYRAHGLKAAATVIPWKIINKISSVDINNQDGLPDQYDLLSELFQNNNRVWLIWFDGGRYDYFEELYPEYFEGELTKVWNGDIGYTGDWAVRHLERDFSGYGLFSVATLRSAQYVNYDGREHFDLAPEIQTPDNATMKERLATLGYLEQTGELAMTGEEEVNQAVLENKDDLDRGGIIRYIKPHPPFEGLEKITTGLGKTKNTRIALINNKLSQKELQEGYKRTYRSAFEYAKEIVPKLDGKVVITSDHGECLDCGQLYHGRNHYPHDHLTHVPWFEIK